ncbi:MAG: hypothetical protein Q9169_004277 [Polycauliona sp. 2 TL-2023]
MPVPDARCHDIKIDRRTIDLPCTMPPERPYKFDMPNFPPRNKFMEDIGDELARDFVKLNTHLPPAALTIQNFIDHIFRVLYAGILLWGRSPPRWSCNIRIDNVSPDSIASGKDLKAALFHRTLELGGDDDTCSLNVVAAEDQSPGSSMHPPNQTSRAIISFKPHDGRYRRTVLVETSEMVESTESTHPSGENSESEQTDNNENGSAAGQKSKGKSAVDNAAGCQHEQDQPLSLPLRLRSATIDRDNGERTSP